MHKIIIPNSREKKEIESTPISISTLAARNGLNGQPLRKQYKDVINGYRARDQPEHAEAYILFPENIGADLNLDVMTLTEDR